MIEKPAILEKFLLSGPQRTAALARGSDVAVTAGAGTGKTRTLVARYLALLADGLPLRQIVAVTFTRKAAREMRNRVRGEIGRYLQQPGLSPGEAQQWAAHYNELDAARINTIHNICSEILRAHPAEAGVDPRFAILDETQAPLLVQEAVEMTLAWAVDTEYLAPLFDLLREGPLLDLIAALINHRLAAQEITRQLPAEMIFSHWQAQLENHQRISIEQLLAAPDFRTAQQVLEQNQADNDQDKAEAQRRMILVALDSLDAESHAGKLRNLAALGAINLQGGSQKSWPGGKAQLDEVKLALRCLRDLYSQEKILSQTLNARDEAIAAAMPAIYTLFAHARDTYQALKEEREGLDFDDLEALAIKLLEDHAPVRDYWQSQVRALLVDEFQDTNEQQCHFIRLLCPDPGKLFIVGDAKQSIYRFRSADVTVFAREKEGIAAQNGNLIDLDISYRAHEPLLKGMNCLLSPILGEDAPGRPLWIAPFAALKSGTKTIAHDLSAPFVECHLTLGTKPEALPRAAEALAERLIQLHADHGLDYGEMAVLCRASNAFQFYENAFDAAGIPYLTVAGKGFYDRPEIRDLLNALAAIADPHDDLALTGLLRSPACGLSDVTLYLLNQGRQADNTLWDTLLGETFLDDPQETNRLQSAMVLIRDLNQQAGRIPVADILKRFLDCTQYRAGLRRAGQLRALRNVAKLLHDIHNSELVSIDAFLEYQGTLRDSGSREGEARSTAGGAVQIMSIHAAKGLEFPVIVLGDAGSSPRSSSRIAIDRQLGILLPYKFDDQRAASYELGAALAKQQDDAEADRLLYVALTRAEQMLFISGYMSQNKFGELYWKGWLAQLADVTGMKGADLGAYDEEGEGKYTFDYLLEETAVRAAFYEPFYPTQIAAISAPAAVPIPEQVAVSPLQEPVFATAPYIPDEVDAPHRVWQVVPTIKSPQAPALLIGSLVHQALAMWRFPNPEFDHWVKARAREYGLTDESRLDHANKEVGRLLTRFQRHPLWRQIDGAARRWHELPFNSEEEGTSKTGYIDLLYQDADGWTLVDFKTDRIRSEADLQKLLAEAGYEQQLRQYGRAVQQLLGVTPRLLLCLLNYDREVRVLTSITFD